MSGMQPLTPLAAGSVALAVTGTTGRVALPGISATTSQGVRQLRQYVITNAGPQTAYIAFGTVAVVAVVATGYPLLPGTKETFSASDAYVAAITASGTASLVISAGDGQGPALGAGATSGGEIPGSTLLSAATVNISTATTTELVAATASQIIRVYRMVLVIGAADNLTFKSASTSLQGGALVFPAGGAITLDYTGDPWFTCTVSEALNLTTTTTAQVSGVVYYTKG